MRFWPVIQVVLLFLVAAVASALFRPPGAAPAETVIHGILIFVLGAFGRFNVALGMLRQSIAMYAAGCFFFFIMLLSVFLFPGWTDRPGTVLLGAAFTQILALATWQLFRSRNFRSEAALLCSAAGAALVGIQIHPEWSLIPERIAALAGAAALAVGAAYCLLKRQRTTISSVTVWVFLSLLTCLLLAGSFSPTLQHLEQQRLLNPAILMSLVLIAALFVFDNLQVERQLRRGPHLQLDASLKDPLTGLANRRALELHGPQLLHQSHEAGRPVSMIIADIDFFKQVNDNHGHLTGDAVLRRTATTLAAQVRKSDLVARYGGEEFVIILPGSPLVPALRLAERMRNAVESETIHYEGQDLQITASFGVATSFPEEPMSLTAMIARADTNLYRAKHNGRNCVMTDELPSEVI